MPRRRRPKYYKKSGVFATPAGFTPTGAGGTRISVLIAASVIMEAAKAKAAKFSTRIPGATMIEAYGEHEAMIVTDGVKAPNAAPFEFGERHPLYGDRRHWYPQPRRSYMSNAARSPAVVAAAAEKYGELEAELLAKEFGFDE